MLWPGSRAAPNRLYPRCAPLHQPKFTFGANPSFFAIGSCFARNVEDYLARAGFPVITKDIAFADDEAFRGSRSNDLLVKYTPGSILAEVEEALGGGADKSDLRLVETSGGLWHDTSLPMYFPAVPYERALERRRRFVELY